MTTFNKKVGAQIPVTQDQRWSYFPKMSQIDWNERVILYFKIANSGSLAPCQLFLGQGSNHPLTIIVTAKQTTQAKITHCQKLHWIQSKYLQCSAHILEITEHIAPLICSVCSRVAKAELEIFFSVLLVAISFVAILHCSFVDVYCKALSHLKQRVLYCTSHVH